MAIVKANYTRSKAKIKATLRYITHRPTLTGERTTRALFGEAGLIEKIQAYQMIDSVPAGTVFFRITISPDPKREDRQRDLDLRTITRQTMLRLGELRQSQIQFIAVEHNDHTDIRHIHVIALIRLRGRERISAKDYKLLRETATRAARMQRRALDVAQSYHSRGHSRQLTVKARGRAVQRRIGGRVRTPHQTCPDCGFRQPMYTLKSGIHWCPTYHLKLNQDREKIRHLQLGL
jgi:hypothetical protein